VSGATSEQKELAARLSEAEAALAEARAERARLWEEVNRLRAERRGVEYYEALAAKMETSVSWRITAPLRIFKTLWIRVRKQLDERGG
jgi:hypothetical protein